MLQNQAKYTKVKMKGLLTMDIVMTTCQILLETLERLRKKMGVLGGEREPRILSQNGEDERIVCT